MTFEVVIAKMTAFFAAVPFSTATWFLLGTLLFFVWLFSKAHRNPESNVDWEDLILEHETNRVSPYKLGYLIGLIVGTWVVVKFADAGTLSWDVFGGYLAYLLGGAGWTTMSREKTNTATIQATGSRPGTVAPKVDDVK